LVEPIAQLLSGLEERRVLLADLNAVTGARVAADAGIAKPDRKRAEAAQFDTITAGHGGGNLVKDSANDYLNVALIEMPVSLGQPVNEFQFRHREQRSRA